MKNKSRHVGKLEILRREPSSANGNPRYFARCAGVSFYTAVDSSLAYSLPNYDGALCEVIVGRHYGRATLDSIRASKGE